MKNIWFIIANPSSGNEKLSKKQKEIEYLLQAKNIRFKFAITNEAKHEIELVNNAVKKGFRKFISVGGDGTLHNIINGIMLQNIVKPSCITVGVIPLGTGNDWIKTYKIPNHIEKAITIISKEKTLAQNIGFLELENNSVYFNNVAGIGFDGYIVKKLNTSKHLGAFAYLSSGIVSLFNYKITNFKIETDTKTFNTKSLMTLIGIGKYCGGGLQLTNVKHTKKGTFAITIAKNFNLFDVFLILKKLFNGTIFTHKKIETLSTKCITITPPKNSTIYVQADGELIGTGKIKATIIEKAINFVIP